MDFEAKAEHQTNSPYDALAPSASQQSNTGVDLTNAVNSSEIESD